MDYILYSYKKVSQGNENAIEKTVRRENTHITVFNAKQNKPKKPTQKWACAIQTHIVRGSTDLESIAWILPNIVQGKVRTSFNMTSDRPYKMWGKETNLHSRCPKGGKKEVTRQNTALTKHMCGGDGGVREGGREKSGCQIKATETMICETVQRSQERGWKYQMRLEGEIWRLRHPFPLRGTGHFKLPPRTRLGNGKMFARQTTANIYSWEQGPPFPCN